jgi:hypothetical protein
VAQHKTLDKPAAMDVYCPHCHRLITLTAEQTALAQDRPGQYFTCLTCQAKFTAKEAVPPAGWPGTVKQWQDEQRTQRQPLPAPQEEPAHVKWKRLWLTLLLVFIIGPACKSCIKQEAIDEKRGYTDPMMGYIDGYSGQHCYRWEKVNGIWQKVMVPRWQCVVSETTKRHNLKFF